MSINLRYVGQELHQALKVRAASEGVTLESLCVRFLWWGLDPGKQDIPATGRQGKELAAKATAILLEKRPHLRPHDPKTCKVYGCGMCAAVKP